MEKSLDIEFQFIKDILQIRSQNMRSWKTFVKRFYGCFCRRRARTSFLMRRPGSRRRMFGWYTGEKDFTQCNLKDLIFFHFCIKTNLTISPMAFSEMALLLDARSKKAKQASRSPRARCASSSTATTRSSRWTRTTWRRPTLPLSTGWRISPNYVILMRALFFTPFDRGN